MVDSQLGVCPIHAEQPAGSSPRDGETYALLEAEINKRLDLHAQAATDWALVSKLAATVLREQGKDLSVATWLLLGWTHLEGASGLAAGVRVLHDMHAHYWDTMTPPAARLRGRRNQMEWLLQELETVLNRDSADWAALDPQQHADLMADWDALDALWQGHDEQAPALFKLHRLLTDLAPACDEDVSDQTRDQAVPQAVTADAHDRPDMAAALQDANVPDASAVPATPDASVPVPSPARHVAPVTADVHAGPVPDTVAGVERAIEQAFDALHALLRELPDELIMLPVLYRLNRVRAWLALDALPVAVEGVSRIPAPPPADQDALQRLIDADDARSVLRFAESRLVPHRFWLDLNRIAWQAASALPDGQPVADAIASDTLYLLQRLPGLQDLSFINSQPLADPATRDWLDSLRGATPAPVVQRARTDSVRPVSTDSLGLATLLAAAGAETQAAARLLDVVTARLQSGSEQFMQR